MRNALLSGVPLKNGKPDLPSGIRIRGDKLFVDKSRTVDGKQIARFTATVDTYLEALTKAAEFEKKLDRIESGEVEAPPKQFNWTLRKTYDEIRKIPQPVGWADVRGKKQLEVYFGYCLRFFGEDRMVSSITREDVSEFCDYLEGLGNADATINRKLSNLSKLLTFAEDQSEGKYKKIKMPVRRKEIGLRRRILKLDRERDIDEERDILNYFSARGDVNAYDVTAFGLDTGMRNAEIWALEMSDVNFDQNMIEVRGVWYASEQRRRTKNDIIRVIPMTARIKEILKRRAMSHGERPFPFNNDWIRYKWEQMRDALNIREERSLFTFYCLRHTCCTRLLQRGTDPVRVQRWMGHRQLATTLGYIHLVPGDLYKARDTLEKEEPKSPHDMLLMVAADLKKIYGQEGLEQLKKLLNAL